jgi:tetratricopeptide (TPR) repeat protein
MLILVNSRMNRIFSLLLLLPLAASLNAQSNGPVNVASADALFLQMQYAPAIRTYESVLSESPRDTSILWRLSRAYVCVGEVEENVPQRVTLMKKAESYARSCIAVDPGNWQGHTWLGAALGYLALDTGVQEQIALSRDLLRETEVALSLNPQNDIALSIRGSFFRALGNVGWFKRQMAKIFLGDIPEGGFVEAEKSLQEAVALAPDIMRHEYELGVLYMDMGRTREACEAFQRASLLPVRVAIDRPRLAKIRLYLNELQCGGENPR